MLSSFVVSSDRQTVSYSQRGVDRHTGAVPFCAILVTLPACECAKVIVVMLKWNAPSGSKRSLPFEKPPGLAQQSTEGIGNNL